MNLGFLKKTFYRFQHRSLVLMYHNIAEHDVDPWELAVSPRNFREHLEVLKKYRVLSVTEFADALKQGSLRNNSVALTFDDGYEDNYIHAAPLLNEFATPAMFFIPTEFSAGNNVFWWDELEEILLTGEQLPTGISIKIGAEVFMFSLDDDANLSPEKLVLQNFWKWHQLPPTKRCTLYFEIWKRLRPLPLPEIHSCLDFLHAWSGISGNNPAKHAMSVEQLLGLKHNSFIETGIHTVTHPALSNHKIEYQRKELSECRDTLVSLGLNALHVAFPYGDFNEDTLKLCRELNLSAAFTTTEKMVTAKTDPLAIGRFQVRNWSGKEFEAQLKRWMTESPS